MRIVGIERTCLSMIQQSAREVYPNEFMALLSVDENKEIISELVLLPGTVYGDRHSIIKTYMAPYDTRIVGSVHSHPSPYPLPSDADLQMFGHYGKVHIIIAKPFDDMSWRAYDYNGTPITLKVVDSQL